MIGDVTARDRLTYGALFAGYGGLELGVQSVLPGVTSWYAEVDPSAARVMAHHHPAVPNLGDVTAVDWATVEPVDVITGGSPCQDLSAAGMRAGMRAEMRAGVPACEAPVARSARVRSPATLRKRRAVREGRARWEGGSGPCAGAAKLRRRRQPDGELRRRNVPAGKLLERGA